MKNPQAPQGRAPDAVETQPKALTFKEHLLNMPRGGRKFGRFKVKLRDVDFDPAHRRKKPQSP
jgi:hypothetical protein